MIISAQVFLTGLTGPWALIEFGYLLWFDIINWTVLTNHVRKKYVRTFWLLFDEIDVLYVMTEL